MHRAITTLLVAIGLLAPAAVASAEPVSRLADLESVRVSPYEFDQVSTHCLTSVAARDVTKAYAGSSSLKVHTENDPICGGSYARGLFHANAQRHLVEGDDFWFGAAIYLEPGFYSAHNGYTDLLRLDSYVQDDGTNTPFAERAEINFASWSNDDLYVRAARGDNAVTLIGPISPSKLPEGSWSWVEVHVHLSATDGAAYTELKVDGQTLGSSRTANLFSGAAPFNRLRYGIVSTDWSGSGNLTAYFDRASISPTERGPLPLASGEPVTPPPPPPVEAGPTSSLVSLWRLDELGGTEAADAAEAAPGVYRNEPTLGAESLSGDPGSAVSFDGIDDHVAIAPTAPLDLTKEITLEAWVKASSFRGSMIRRNNSYELRPLNNRGVLFRLWIEGTLQALAAPPETLTLGEAHFLVGTYNGQSMRIYADGSLVARRPLTGLLSHDDSDPLYIGRNDYVDTYLKGIVDNVAIYSEALTWQEIFEQYEAARPIG
jgi:hypothetical protein